MSRRAVAPEAWRGLWLALFAVAFGTNVPTPLLLVYRDQLALSPTVLTAIFGVYAAGLVPALLLAGPLSDRRGRRGVVLLFVVLAAAASALLIAASASFAALLVGRLLQGVVSGVVFSVGTAWMAETVREPAVASRRAAVAMSLGFSLGPLTSGLVAQWLPAPTVLPYLLHLILVVLALVRLRSVPETVVRRPGRGRILDLGVPRAARPAFLTFVVPAALCVFTFPSVSITVLPLGLQAAMPGIDLAVTGLVAGVTLGVGVVVQPFGRRLGIVRTAPLAALAGALGLGLGLAALSWEIPLLLLPTAVLLGTAYGWSLTAGLTATQWLADPAARGALVATFYALTYLGFGTPVLLSLASDGTDYAAALGVLAVIALALAGWLAVGPGGRRVAARRREIVPVAAPRARDADPVTDGPTTIGPAG